LIVVRRVDCDEGVLRSLVSGEQEQSKALVSFPMVEEEEERSAPNMAATGRDPEGVS
jgi:hypothetical protein